jgi:hypothetical protein
MIKTLRITSIVAVVLAVVIFVLSVSYGFRSDENIKEFLSSPGVIDQFTAAEGQRIKASNSQISPLVQQAQAFALYLNPPAPKLPTHLPGRETGKVGPQLSVTPKFKVIGTSYYEQRPELSLVLIDEPGKGIHWVKQSTTVGHLFIEQVQDGLVIVKSGTETFELVAERNPPKTISGSSVNFSKKPASTVSSKSGIKQPPSRDRNLVKRVPGKIPQGLQANERDERLEELYENLRKIQQNSDNNPTDNEFDEKERAMQIEKLISNFKASYVSPEEAKKLEDLGEQLKNSEWEPNQIPSEDQ